MIPLIILIFLPGSVARFPDIARRSNDMAGGGGEVVKMKLIRQNGSLRPSPRRALAPGERHGRRGAVEVAEERVSSS